MTEVVGNFFPCDAFLPDGTYVRMVRVLVTTEQVLVLGEKLITNPDTGSILSKEPTCLYAGPYVPETTQIPSKTAPKRRQRLTAGTVTGPLVAQVLFGCGCGSSLRFLSVADSLALVP